MLTALAVIGGYLFGKKYGNNNLCGWILALWIAVSPSISFLTVHFIKNAGSMVLLLITLFFIENYFEEITYNKNRNSINLFLMIISFVLLIFSHKLIFFIGLYILFAYIINKYIQSGYKRDIVLLFLLAILGILVVAVLFKVILVQDMKRILPELSLNLRWPLTQISENIKLHLILKIEIIIALLSIVPTIFIIRNNKRKIIDLFYILLVLIMFNPFLNYENLGLGYRLVLMVFFPGAILWSNYLSKNRLYFKLSVILLIIFGFFTTKVYNYEYDKNEYSNYARVIEKIKEKNYLIMIAHQGLNYYYDWTTKKDALAFIPDKSKYPKILTWRISWVLIMMVLRVYCRKIMSQSIHLSKY